MVTNRVKVARKEARTTQILSDWLQKKLLIPGWAGELTRDEVEYIKSQLRQSPTMKRRWGFRPSAKRLSEKLIRAIARNGLSAKQK